MNLLEHAGRITSSDPSSVSATADGLQQWATRLGDGAEAAHRLTPDDEALAGPAKNAYRSAANHLVTWYQDAARAFSAAGQVLRHHADVLDNARPKASRGEAQYRQGVAYTSWAESYSGRTLDLASISMVMQYHSAGLDLQEDGAHLIVDAVRAVDQSAAASVATIHAVNASLEEPSAGIAGVGTLVASSTSTTGMSAYRSDGPTIARTREQSEIGALPVTVEDLRKRSAEVVVAQTQNVSQTKNPTVDRSDMHWPSAKHPSELGYPSFPAAPIDPTIESTDEKTGLRKIEFGPVYPVEYFPDRLGRVLPKHPELLMPGINQQLAVMERGAGYYGLYNSLSLQNYTNQMTRLSQADRQAMRLATQVAAEYGNDRQRAAADLRRRYSSAVYELNTAVTKYNVDQSNYSNVVRAVERIEQDASRTEKQRDIEVGEFVSNARFARGLFNGDYFLSALSVDDGRSYDAYVRYKELVDQGVPSADAIRAVNSEYPGVGGIPFSDDHPYDDIVPKSRTGADIVSTTLPESPTPTRRTLELDAYRRAVTASRLQVDTASERLSALPQLPNGQDPKVRLPSAWVPSPFVGYVPGDIMRYNTEYEVNPVRGMGTAKGAGILWDAIQRFKKNGGRGNLPDVAGLSIDVAHALPYLEQIRWQYDKNGAYDISVRQLLETAELQSISEQQRGLEANDLNTRVERANEVLTDTTDAGVRQDRRQALGNVETSQEVRESVSATQQKIEDWAQDWEKKKSSYLAEMSARKQEMLGALGSAQEQTRGTAGTIQLARENDNLEGGVLIDRSTGKQLVDEVTGQPITAGSSDFYWNNEFDPLVNRIVNDVFGPSGFQEPAPWQEEIMVLMVNDAHAEGFISQEDVDLFNETREIPRELFERAPVEPF
ncbi:MAG: hypothetical protein ACRC0L_09150 [Angustibacter sp.]